ncbi:MAG: hypothetical protein ACE5GB_15525, partial [Acidimicrobiales bacterium]
PAGRTTAAATTGPANGPRIRCGYFQVVSIDTPIDVARTPIDSPIPGFPYTLSCWYQPPGEAAGDTVGGYPRIVFFEPSTPAGPDLVSTAQVTAFAREHMRFEPPVPALAPADRQIVGIQTWLAVTSQLDYTPVTAQAGLVWATVRASFRDVTWILGDGSELVCTADATTLWDPDLPGDAQHSDCTHVYTDASGEAPYEASVTVNWQVDVRDNTNPATWRPYETFELTTALAIPVDEIQAVIR